MTRRKKLAVGVGATVLSAAAYLFFWPIPVDPRPWTPPDAPALEGPFAANDALAAAERLPIGGVGPEDVDVDAQGRIYGGLVDGRIVRMAPDGSEREDFADTGGRPLGLDFDAGGNLIVADADKGLLSVDRDGNVSELVSEHQGQPFVFTDDLDIASNGTIYFTDASKRWNRHHVRDAFFEHGAHGRLFSYEPKGRELRLLLEDLYFANGVAVAADDSFLLFNETSEYRVTKLWLTGERAGKTEIVIDNLPGLPDGISRGEGGVFWVALFGPRVSTLDYLLPRPVLRGVVYRLPRFLQPEPARHAFVLGITAKGEVVANLQDASPESYSPLTSVEQHGSFLYLGSLEYPGVARIAAP